MSEQHPKTAMRPDGGFVSDEIVQRYVERATEGLFDQERKLVERYFTKPGGEVLDVGCGTGRTTAPLSKMGFEVTGIDVSEQMIAAARSTFDGIDFRVGDATDLDFEDETFDYVLFSYNGLDYVHPEERRLRALCESRRVLRTDGLLAFSTHNHWYALPAAVADWSYLWTYYVSRGNSQRWWSRYKRDPGETETFEMYVVGPRRQRAQLRRCGLKPVAVCGKRDGPLRWFESMLYYVARKPSTAGAES
ncbi:MAG: class I SAM-dependent methyltransferase [Halobacteriota archaeon]